MEFHVSLVFLCISHDIVKNDTSLFIIDENMQKCIDIPEGACYNLFIINE